MLVALAASMVRPKEQQLKQKEKKEIARLQNQNKYLQNRINS
jgi:hypothetical protein